MVVRPQPVGVGAAESDGLTYALEASEQIVIRLEDGELVEQELLAQQSLLRSAASFGGQRASRTWCSPAVLRR